MPVRAEYNMLSTDIRIQADGMSYVGFENSCDM